MLGSSFSKTVILFLRSCLRTLQKMRTKASGFHNEPLTIWPALHAIAVVGLVLRLIVAWHSLYIYNSDELFQYLEQAHRVVYGYGFVPWEYRFGARNWLLPGFIAIWLEVLRSLGLDQPRIYIPLIKSIFAVLSVTIVYSNFTIGRRLFGEITGWIAALLAAIWFELIYISTFPTPEVLGCYALVGALALITGHQSGGRAMVIGLLLGVSVALRLQYAAPALVLWLLVGLWWKVDGLIKVTIGAAVLLIVSGILDAWTWGAPFASYYNNVLFNLKYGVSRIFGSKPLLWYFYSLTGESLFLHAFALVYGILAWRRCWPILLVLISLLLPHSLVLHKEYRFIFTTIPLLLVLLADFFACGIAFIHNYRIKLIVTTALIASVIWISVIGGIHKGIFRQDDRLLATLDLSKRDDVIAVLDLCGPWWGSGAFYYLHHNVPFYFRQQIEGLLNSDICQVASHLIMPLSEHIPDGFRVSARYGGIAVLDQLKPPSSFYRLQKDGREPQQGGVDGLLTPTVRPFF